MSEVTKTITTDVIPALRDDRPAYTEIKHEKARHRLMATLIARGCTMTEVAQALGMTLAWVSNITKQEWFREQVVQLIHSAGNDAMKRLHDAADRAAEILITSLEDESMNHETKRKTCNDILDRRFGKPNQPVTHKRDLNALTDAELVAMLPETEKTATS